MIKVPINPKILQWAREERNRISIEILAERMKRDPLEIEMWESGKDSPTYGQLEDLAYKYLKIPLAVFFFPDIPDIPDPLKKLRRLPDYEWERLSEDTLQKIRLAQAYQDSLAIIAKDYIGKKIFKDIKAEGMSAAILANKVRKYFNITLKEQFSFKSTRSAFNRWRHIVEERGIFTFKDTFKDKFISGFCLLDNNYPVIFINNSNSFSRQIFTLMHELGHILTGVNGITDIDESYLDYLNERDKVLEIFCNEFASQLLVPDESFEEAISLFEKHGVGIVGEIATQYSVSREVVLRRLLNKGVISESLYLEKTSEWNRDFLRHAKDKAGGNYYLTRLAYLGEGFTKIAYAQYSKGQIDQPELAHHLNIKAKYLDNLLGIVR
ncbi:MAG: ImmA/IrrE family metallo-endopeptidase [Candidatus Omnitrophica bacterium]|nr:ImmA/IrrE family metallo-endopeptidase [Candidatus Omnitrophota bacterium]